MSREELEAAFADYVDLVEAAQLLKVNPITIRRLIKKKKIEGVILFGGKYLIDRGKLQEFAKTYDPQGYQLTLRLF